MSHLIQGISLEKPDVRLPAKLMIEARFSVLVAYIVAYFPPKGMVFFVSAIGRNCKHPSYDQAEHFLFAVKKASLMCRGQWCLQRSLAVVVLCSLHGYCPDFIIGVRPSPFSMHAWIESEGVPVQDRKELTWMYLTAFEFRSV